MSRSDWNTILEWFKVPNYHHVYVLGCFAKRVTLYSQQVRALNLVTALSETQVISENTEVVVVGGGAAGLTAALAAAKKQAKVVLLEELEDLMELQRNNRQRWLHPYIYDWPDMESSTDDADLPLLSWSAGYAESVAQKIESGWEVLKKRYSITVGQSVRNINITHDGMISWGADKGGSGILHKPVIILAVGFGLEPQNDYQDSYWTEDDIDASFRRSLEGQSWLVSGYGDGAFSDLMRLCIRRFRHAEIAELFGTAPGIDGIKEDLRAMQARTDLTPEALSTKFNKLSIGGLADVLEPKLRKRGPKVFLMGPDAFPYSERASVLNRLIVKVLAKLGAFTFIPGPLSEVRRTESGYAVITSSSRHIFNRVVLRHGPFPKLKESFNDIWECSHELRQRWDGLSIQLDETRKKLWEPGYWGAEVSLTHPQWMDSATSFTAAVKRLGVRASSLIVIKELRSDGISTLKYEIRGLAVISGALTGLKFYYGSTSGQVGPPEFDSAAQRLKLIWEDESTEESSLQDKSFDNDMSAARERSRKLIGTIRFPKALGPNDQPLNFGLSFVVLNANALSSWEFEQLYEQSQRVHFNGDYLQHATEYMARVVWFPVDNLKMRLTLPGRCPGPPFPSLFIATGADQLPRDEVIRDSMLHIYPSFNSGWNTQHKRWEKAQTDDLIQPEQFTKVSAQTWELSIERPPVGSCYSIDWHLPSSSGSSILSQLERETIDFRRQLLEHRRLRQQGNNGEEIRQILEQMYRQIATRYKLDDQVERFAVSILTYNQDERRLLVSDAVVNGKDADAEMWDFWLPFGAGLGGACFKQQGNDPFIYLAPQENEMRRSPESYMPFPNRERHTVLVAIPLGHPRFDSSAAPGFERSRQCIGVVDIGSNSPVTKLNDLTKENRVDLFRELIGWCNMFCNSLCNILSKHSSNNSPV